MNILSTLTTDHDNVEALFKRFEATDADELEELGRLRDQILEQLAIHAEIEEQLLYPALREAAEDDVLESLEEHHAVKAVLAELERMAPAHERFRAKMTVVIENVRHHVEEEEGDVFPGLRAEVDARTLELLGTVVEQAKKVVPTHPHPLVPGTATAQLVAGPWASVVDRVRDLVSSK